MEPIELISLPFDLYQRYRAAAQFADQVRAYKKRANLRILDVGGASHTPDGHGFMPLAHFLPKDLVVGVDLLAEPLPNYSQASGLCLPFGDEEFDVVVSCDTLEHIPPEARQSFLDELVRVTREFVVLIAPFSSEGNRKAESILNDYWTAQGIQHRHLREHLSHGLPLREGVRAVLEERDLCFLEFADGYLPHWLTMMLMRYAPGQSPILQREIDRYFNRHFSPDSRREPSYRHGFLISRQANADLLPFVASGFGSLDGVPTTCDLEFASDLIDLLSKCQPAASEIHSRLAAEEAENARLRELVAGYEQGRFMRMMRWLHGQRKRVRGGARGGQMPNTFHGSS
jgi:hypothetical protein